MIRQAVKKWSEKRSRLDVCEGVCVCVWLG